MELLLRPLIAKTSAGGFNLSISDGSDSGRLLTHRVGDPGGMSRTQTSKIYGNRWHITLTPTVQHMAVHRDLLWLLPVLVLVTGLLVLVFLTVLQRVNRRLTASQSELAGALARAHESEDYLRELSRQDALTGLSNRRAFIESLDAELLRGERYRHDTALLMIDIDHFKSVNDRWGHPVGDEVLTAFADSCRRLSRRVDVVGRLGGEEFAILMPHTDADQAVLLAERLRNTVADTPIPVGDGGATVHITVSIGVAVATDGHDGSGLLRRADRALYAAKRAGRDRTELDADGSTRPPTA